MERKGRCHHAVLDVHQYTMALEGEKSVGKSEEPSHKRRPAFLPGEAELWAGASQEEDRAEAQRRGEHGAVRAQ